MVHVDVLLSVNKINISNLLLSFINHEGELRKKEFSSLHELWINCVYVFRFSQTWLGDVLLKKKNTFV